MLHVGIDSLCFKDIHLNLRSQKNKTKYAFATIQKLPKEGRVILNCNRTYVPEMQSHVCSRKILIKYDNHKNDS